jgi:hypothetical protein
VYIYLNNKGTLLYWLLTLQVDAVITKRQANYDWNWIGWCRIKATFYVKDSGHRDQCNSGRLGASSDRSHCPDALHVRVRSSAQTHCTVGSEAALYIEHQATCKSLCCHFPLESLWRLILKDKGVAWSRGLLFPSLYGAWHPSGRQFGSSRKQAVNPSVRKTSLIPK